MREHTVKAFEQELALLDKRVSQMGGLAEQQLGRAFEALERRDPKLAADIVSGDALIDQLERELQDQAIVMIAKRQPLPVLSTQILRRVLLKPRFSITTT